MSDLFTGFTLFNRRISSILQAIPLHIVISREHCRRQIDFLSSHLTFHEHQVISINISDTIRDDSFIIRLLFNRHNFPNLRSYRIELTENNDELTRIILTHKSSYLHSVELQYPYHYLNLSNYQCIPSNIRSLSIRIAGSPSTVSIHSVIRFFRLCHQIQYLWIALYSEKRFEKNNNINVSNHSSSVTENDLPILSQLTYFELLIGSVCNIWSISYILRSMPNLKHFCFQLLVQKSLSFTNEYLNGYVWQQMFELYLPYLSKFEYHMKHLKLYIENEKCNITWSSSLFQHITYLLVEVPIIKSSWSNYLYNIVNFRETIDEENNAQEYVTYISDFVNLKNVTKIEFGSTYSIHQWKNIIFILKACPNVISLIISIPLLLLSKLIDHSSLISIFKQIKMIKLVTKNNYFPSNFVFKLVERFPSLSHIELQTYSFNNCIFIINIFLMRLEQLSYLKISYDKDTLFDDPFT
ncbi:unnamed protein product, partial [Rotaria sordida]